MFRLVSRTLMVVGAALLVSLPAAAHGDVQPAWQLPRAPSLRLDRAMTRAPLVGDTRLAAFVASDEKRSLGALHPLAATVLPLAIDPGAVGWWTRRTTTPRELELGNAAPHEQAQPSTDEARTLTLPELPTLLRYTHEDTNVALSIIPGGPCTGACLRLAGSF